MGAMSLTRTQDPAKRGGMWRCWLGARETDERNLRRPAAAGGLRKAIGELRGQPLRSSIPGLQRVIDRPAPRGHASSGRTTLPPTSVSR